MTYEEAIKTLKDYHDVVIGDYGSKIDIAMRMAIESIEKQFETSKLRSNLEDVSKYRWHDLRKNPNDIPWKYKMLDESFGICFDNRKIIFVDQFGQITEHAHAFNGVWEDIMTHNKLIAWLEIESFEVEE